MAVTKKAWIMNLLKNTSPVKMVFIGYLSYMIIGWILLSLPIMQNAAVSTLDNLFISTSAISTTGLVTVDISSSYSFMGQLVILILIQLGGIGYMTFGSFIVLTTKKEISEERAKISKTVFSIPKNFIIDKFIRSVILFTLSIETAGVIALTAVFIRKGVPHPVWQAVFHSISAFCTAGFSLFPDSFMGYRDDFWVNAILSLLSFSGAIGFIVFVDIWRRLRGKSAHMTLTSQIIIRTIAILTAAGTVLIFLTETSMQTLPLESRLLASFFQAMTSITTVGFNSVDISLLARGSLMLITILMVIGAAPSGTGGGLKTTTLTAIIGVMKSALRGRKEVTFWKARIPEDRVITAVASLGFYLTFLIFGTYLLTLIERHDFIDLLFEAASALGTVGLSVGITSALSVLGKIVIILLMFIGRLGPLTFGLALFVQPKLIFDDNEVDLAV